MDLKEEILRLLREDPEFRREVMELLGLAPNEMRELKELVRQLTEVVNKLVEGQAKIETRSSEAQKRSEERLTRLESAVEKLAEAQKRSEERLTRLESAVEKLAEAQKRSEERLTRLESAVEKLAEAQKRSEERLTRLESAVEKLAEAQKRSEERLTRVEENLVRLERKVGNIGARWGIDQEEVVREFMAEVFKQEGFDVSLLSSYTYVDEQGVFGEKGDVYEVDILKRNGTTYLIEVKAYAQPKDVSRFNHTCYVVSKVLKLENPVKMMLANVVTQKAVERAKNLGIRLIYGEVEQ
ncbi:MULTISPECIES: DUF3782 domain-containing protein [Metallosphaera]|uniref:DUF3782 domain-containing protein n=1 Tax=Metallosphaera prunae TaxID=47304 RepID=A0A4D8RXX9_METPR|nr:MULTISPECIES: DUF3782 domain-containing protein [Metallosphaera]MCH1770877.1 DUF3782 domain-containing protein [Metallosphaera sedula]QCO30594.1 DUF3782 domain-containing protein [Metallosphaera prunae]BBL47999.1 chromosome partition protein Smc [Metallosphaera sedula]